LIQGLLALLLAGAHQGITAGDFSSGSFEEGYGVCTYLSPEAELRTIGNDWDLNDDGYLDLVVINEFELHFGKQVHDTYSYVFWGGEDGFRRARCDSFSTHGAECAALADFNRDGWTDIVVANSTHPYSYVVYGSEKGYATARRDSFKARANHGSVSVADLNEDGWLDLVWSNWSGSINGYSRIYWGDRQGFDAHRTDSLPTGRAHGNLVADFDADGYADILWTVYYANNDATHRPSLIYWGGQNGFAAGRYTELASVGPGDDISAGDLDKDGFLDIVIPNHSSKPPPSWAPYDYSFIYYGEGRRSFKLDSLRTTGAWGASAADVNNDGWLDICFAGSESLLYYGSSAGFKQPQVIPMRFTSCAMLADFDNDGGGDIVLGRPLVTMVLLKIFYRKGRFWDEAFLEPGGGVDAGVTKDLGNPATKRDEAFYTSGIMTAVTSDDSVAVLEGFQLDAYTTWQGDGSPEGAEVQIWASASPYPWGGDWSPWYNLEAASPYPVAGKAFRCRLCLSTGARTSVVVRDVALDFRVDAIPDSPRITQQAPRQFEIWLPASTQATPFSIFDGSGRRVSVLRPDKLGHAYWLGEDDCGRALPAGVYFLVDRKGTQSRSHKLVLLN